MRLAETGIVAAANKLRDRLRMTVGRVEIEPRIERDAERIDLPVRENFDSRAVGSKAKDVAALHGSLVPIVAFHMILVREAVTGIDPAVGHQRERIYHAVRV